MIYCKTDFLCVQHSELALKINQLMKKLEVNPIDNLTKIDMKFTLKNSEKFQKVLALNGHILLIGIEMKKGNIDAITLNFNFDNENVISCETVKVPLRLLEKKNNANMYYFGIGRKGFTTFPKILSTSLVDKHIYISATSQEEFDFVVYYGIKGVPNKNWAIFN